MCEFCSKIFSLKSSLMSHLSKVHEIAKPYTCTVCNKQFSNGSALENHHRSHKKTKMYCCEICNKQFQNNSALKIHMGSHTKPYSCEHCGKKFGYKNSLELHLLTHNKDKIKSLLNLPEGAFERIFSWRDSLIFIGMNVSKVFLPLHKFAPSHFYRMSKSIDWLKFFMCFLF